MTRQAQIASAVCEASDLPVVLVTIVSDYRGEARLDLERVSQRHLEWDHQFPWLWNHQIAISVPEEPLPMLVPTTSLCGAFLHIDQWLTQHFLSIWEMRTVTAWRQRTIMGWCHSMSDYSNEVRFGTDAEAQHAVRPFQPIYDMILRCTPGEIRRVATASWLAELYTTMSDGLAAEEIELHIDAMPNERFLRLFCTLAHDSKPLVEFRFKNF